MGKSWSCVNGSGCQSNKKVLPKTPEPALCSREMSPESPEQQWILIGGEMDDTAAGDKKDQTEKKSEGGRQLCTTSGISENTKQVRSSNKEQAIPKGQGMFYSRTRKSTGPSASTEEKQKKGLPRGKKDKSAPTAELFLASAATDQKETPVLGVKEERVPPSHTKAAHSESSEPPNQRAFEKHGVKSAESNSSSILESSVDHEEDLYRGAEEIKTDSPVLIVPSFEPEMDILEYCGKEWKGNTDNAKRVRKGYKAVSHKFTSIRRVRGDNYCAIRATLFQALSLAIQVPDWLQSEDLLLLPAKLMKKYNWATEWRIRCKVGKRIENISGELKECLRLLREKWESVCEMETPAEAQAACDELFRNEEEEYRLYDAVIFLMLSTAIGFYEDNEKGEKVPDFSLLLFSRDTSSNPHQLMTNHLNQIGHTGGLEQVEMFLLAYTLRHTIKVYRLDNHGTEEFITLFPSDPDKDWPVVTLITEDDRHYNIPVRMCEETSL
uniref:OTU deubiquitinase with linear linkage specificity n=1 Tax=Sphenodon punctatus TaxID=8508 RepID=A0A8D0H9N6_SPHPU